LQFFNRHQQISDQAWKLLKVLTIFYHYIPPKCGPSASNLVSLEDNSSIGYNLGGNCPLPSPFRRHDTTQRTHSNMPSLSDKAIKPLGKKLSNSNTVIV